jgi:hypothetical protein
MNVGPINRPNARTDGALGGASVQPREDDGVRDRKSKHRGQYLDLGKGRKPGKGLVKSPEKVQTPADLAAKAVAQADKQLAKSKKNGSTMSVGATESLIQRWSWDLDPSRLAAIRGWYDSNANQLSPKAQVAMTGFIKVGAKDESMPLAMTGVVQKKDPALGRSRQKGKAKGADRAKPGFVRDVDLDALVQRAPADSGLVASAIAVMYQRPDVLRKLIRRERDGTYSAKLFVRKTNSEIGHRVTVKVGGPLAQGVPGRDRGEEPNAEMSPGELWAGLLEAAVLRLKGGAAQERAEWGAANLTLLTGNETKSAQVFPDSNPDAIFGFLKKKLKRNDAVLARTCAVDLPPSERIADRPAAIPGSGLASGRLYAIISVTEVNGQKQVEVCSPLPHDEVQADQVARQDRVRAGRFLVPIEDFVQRFTEVHSARTNNLPLKKYDPIVEEDDYYDNFYDGYSWRSYS